MDEVATVVVEVLSITSRQVRRRGMKPLVAARVSDESGTMTVTFFNQPWLERRYRPGTRLLLTGKYQGHRGFRVNEHAETGELVVDRGGHGHLPGVRRADVGADRRARARAPRDDARRARAAARPASARWSACPTAGRRSTPRTSATRRAAAGGSRSTSSCCCRSRSCAAARAAARARGRRALDAAGRADGALAARLAAVHAHRRPAHARWPTLDDDIARRPADAAAADGRGRLRQDRRRALRDAARGRVRRPGRADGADRDARRAALRDAAEADAGRARAGRAAHRLDARGPPRRPARQAGDRRAEAARRHARADRGRGRVRPPGRRGRRRAAPLRRQPAPRAGPQGAGRASRRTSCT